VVFAAYQPAQEPEPAAAPLLGDCTWHELVADDPTSSWNFRPCRLQDGQRHREVFSEKEGDFIGYRLTVLLAEA
jgi:hypothetical protein